MVTNFKILYFYPPGVKLSCLDVAIGARGLGFEPWLGQIGTVLSRACLRCIVFSELCSPADAQPRR